ncbi:MAG: GAF domain-containing protein [Endomicrobia bacterium]|nr:GAF domain-containing protein [Endomicrobiia bacterium]MCL2506363.1 GAF domain-containing protein [Endomicrobiia bacterium]
MVITIILIVFAAVFTGLFVWVEHSRRKAAVREEALEKQILGLNEKIQLNAMDLDNLLVMLVGLHEFGMSATDIMSKEELVESVIEVACKLIHSDAGSLMLIDQENNELYIAASKGIPADVAAAVTMKIGQGIAGRVAQTGRPIFCEDIESDIRFLRPNVGDRYQSKSFISVPLRVKNRVVGVLNINAPREIKNFEDRDVRLLTILADQAAMTLENIELYNNLHNFYFEMIQTLARAIDAKDSYTFDHADRARHYAKLIAERMHLPQAIVRHVEFAALMHDIGKIGIEDHILRKKGKLTSEEFEVIKKHPVIGNKIISPVAFLRPVAPMVLYHQEWYDGSGYPEGLIGEEIPLGSRIVAAIDAYDAMTSDRPYRKALPRDYAISELKKGAGTQFDPNVVDVFVNILKDESLN